MAVIVTDNRTTASTADATTGWTGSATVTLGTSQPDPVEGTGRLGMVVSNATQNAFFTLPAPVNMGGTGTLVYAWVFPRGEMDTTVNGGIQIQLGDGTNRIGFHLAGSDRSGFRHDQGPVGWQCLVLDTANLPTNRTVFAGSFAALNLSAITQIGIAFKTLVKSVGGVENCFWDVIRYGNGGLTITGGTAGDPGKFSEIAALDRSSAAGRAYGIIRELGAGLFGLQGPLRFGDSIGTSSTYFYDTNTTVAFEDRGFTSDKYRIDVVGNTTGSTLFQLGNKSGTGDAAGGSDGCTIQVPATASAVFDASNANLQNFRLYGSTLAGFLEGVTFSSNATNGPNHEITGSTFRRCGQVNLGRVFTRTTEFTAYNGAAAALLWNENINIRNSSFTSNTDMTNDPAGIEHPSAAGSPYTYDGLTFGANDFDIFNSSGSTITINAINGSNPATHRGSTVIIENPVTLTLTGLVPNSEVRIFRVSDNAELAGIENSGTTFQYAYNYSGDTPIYIVVHHLQFRYLRITGVILGPLNATLPIQQQTDRVYSNP
jgi:hypothetical protein